MIGEPQPGRTPHNPTLRALTAFPIAFFTGALCTDIAYYATMNLMWANFSTWLLAAGMAFATLAAVAAVAALLGNRRRPEARPGALFILGGIVVLAIGLLDNLVHSRDGWNSVVPAGMGLSAAIVAVMALMALAARTRRAPAVARFQPSGVPT